jgi:hypothetical protein
MMRLLALSVLALGVLPLLNAALPGRPTRAAESLHSLGIVMQRPAGPAVLLQFEVRADSAAAAYEAASAAAYQLVPGGFVSIPEPGTVTAQWAQWGWAWSDAELPVRVAYNPSGAPPLIGPDAVIAALQTWSSVPSSRFAYSYGGFTDRQASLRDSGPDGHNVIAWESLDCSTACVLGVTTREASHESDLILNSNPGARLGNGTGDTADARSVILHETGHMAGLEHSCPALFGTCTEAELNAVMYYQYRGTKRKLAADDLAGISALYPVRVAPPPTAPPPQPSPGQPPAPEIAVILEPGWNLTLLPPGPIGPTMQSLACASAVYAYNGQTWDVWLRAASAPLLTLSTAASGQGYWVYATDACAHVF